MTVLRLTLHDSLQDLLVLTRHAQQLAHALFAIQAVTQAGRDLHKEYSAIIGWRTISVDYYQLPNDILIHFIIIRPTGICIYANSLTAELV